MALAARQSTRAAAGGAASCSSAVAVCTPTTLRPSARLARRNVVTPAPASTVAASSSGRVVMVRAASSDMARWEQQVREGSVANVSVPQAAKMVEQGGWVLLDVRPPTETGKVGITGAVDVPLFCEDPSNSIGSLMKKAATIGTGGWWLGGSHMIPNTEFLAQVQARVPKDTGVIIGCQKGLRSLAAAEQLSRAGYSKVAWINGGFDTARPGDLATTNGRDIRYAGIGGLSEVLGWTEVQQEEKAGFMGGVAGVLGLVALILLADLALFGYEQIQYMHGTPLK